MNKTDYSKTRDELHQAIEKARTSKADLNKANKAQQQAHEEHERLQAELVNIRARHEMGTATAKEVKTAQDATGKAAEKLSEAEQNYKVKQQVAQLAEKRKTDILEAFPALAKEYHQKQLDPQFKTLAEAMKQANDAIRNIQRQVPEIEADYLKPDDLVKGIGRFSRALVNKYDFPEGHIRAVRVDGDFIRQHELCS